MANIGRKWRRVMAVGCSHGEFIHPKIRQQVLEFRKRFQPEIRFELGDLIDTACFRSGAQGTKDEARSPRDDQAAALRWLQEYEPNRIAWGNHCTRLYDLQDHPKAIVAELARRMWNDLTDEAARLKAKTVPYDIEEGWFVEGGYAWGHGYMFNEQALRDHAETLGMPVVMAHTHTPKVESGRVLRTKPSFCVGALADDRNLKYGRRRRASVRHGHGIVFGEMCETDADLHLICSPNNTPLRLPSYL